MGFGAEEIEFYTINYPKSIGVDWEIENALKKELSEVRECLPDRILFLNDLTRSRNFFEHHLRNMMPLKRKWFLEKENVDVLMVDDMSPDEVGAKEKEYEKICSRVY